MNRPITGSTQAAHIVSAVRLTGRSTSAAGSAVPWASLRVLARPGTKSISAYLTGCPPGFSTASIDGSNSNSDRGRCKCYRDQCYSKIFHSSLPFEFLSLAGRDVIYLNGGVRIVVSTNKTSNNLFFLPCSGRRMNRSDRRKLVQLSFRSLASLSEGASFMFSRKCRGHCQCG